MEHLVQRAQEVLAINGRQFELGSADILHMIKTREPNATVKVSSERRSRGTERQFLRLILLVMLDSPKLPVLVERIQGLSPNTQQVVGVLMQEMVDWEEDDKDRDLRAEVYQLEERYATVMAQLERRNREFRDVELQLQRVNKTLDRTKHANVRANWAKTSD